MHVGNGEADGTRAPHFLTNVYAQGPFSAYIVSFLHVRVPQNVCDSQLFECILRSWFPHKHVTRRNVLGDKTCLYNHFDGGKALILLYIYHQVKNSVRERHCPPCPPEGISTFQPYDEFSFLYKLKTRSNRKIYFD